MKKLFYLSICLPLLAFAADGPGVKFDEVSSWQEVLARAELENKFIFIDCYTPGCQWCVKMTEETFPDENVGKLFNEKFIAVKLNFASDSKGTEHAVRWTKVAADIKQFYPIRGYPSYLFFSPEGKMVGQAIGYRPPEDFIKIVKDMIDPEKQPEKPDGQLLALYKQDKTESIIKKQELEKLWSGDKPTNPNPDWNELRGTLEKKCGAECADRIIWQSRPAFYMRAANAAGFVESIDKQIEKFPPRSDASLAEMESVGKLSANAQWVLNNTADKALVGRALAWMEICTQLGQKRPDAGVMLVKARALHRLDRKNEAIKVLEETIAQINDHARKMNAAAKKIAIDPVKSTAELTETLEKIKKGEPSWSAKGV